MTDWTRRCLSRLNIKRSFVGQLWMFVITSSIIASLHQDETLQQLTSVTQYIHGAIVAATVGAIVPPTGRSDDCPVYTLCKTASSVNVLAVMLVLGLRGLALAKNSRPKSWRTTMFTMNFHRLKWIIFQDPRSLLTYRCRCHPWPFETVQYQLHSQRVSLLHNSLCIGMALALCEVIF